MTTILSHNFAARKKNKKKAREKDKKIYARRNFFGPTRSYRDAGSLRADVRGGHLVGDDDGAGIEEGLGVLAGGLVGAVQEHKAVTGEGGRGGEEEEGSSGTSSLGGQGTVERR